MIEEFESYFDVVDVQGLKDFLKEAKEESEWIKSQGEEIGADVSDVVKFMSALLENIESEIQNINSLADLDFNKKVRLYALIHLFHDLCGSMEEDEFDEDFMLDGDIDEFDEEEEEYSDEDDENSPGGNINGNGRIIKLE